MRSCSLRPNRARGGFTLLEALATLVVVLLTFVFLGQFMGTVDSAWKSGASDPFAEAQAAFESIAQNLSAATLEPYQDYADVSGAFRNAASTNFVPDHLARRSDLAFVCGQSSGASGLLASTGRMTTTTGVFFAAPVGQTQLYAQSGLDHLLNARGYFVEFGGDTSGPGFFSGLSRLRWRLKEIAQPSESLQIFASTTSAPWLEGLAGSSATPSILAENVIALVVLPERAASDMGAALAPGYAYDSRDATKMLTVAQLPPRARLVLAAIEETAAQQLAARNGSAPPVLVSPTLFQDTTKLDSDVATLDSSLTAAKVRHRIYQREIELTGSAWSDTP